jgi:hypothetical protein
MHMQDRCVSIMCFVSKQMARSMMKRSTQRRKTSAKRRPSGGLKRPLVKTGLGRTGSSVATGLLTYALTGNARAGLGVGAANQLLGIVEGGRKSPRSRLLMRKRS